MGVPTSEVGYTPAMPRREDHEVHKGHVVELGGGTFCLKSCRFSDNVEKYARAEQVTVDNIMRRMRIACWITKATNTHSQ